MGGVVSAKSPVGVCGIGRIGKLLVWLLTARKEHERVVVSTGRKTGKSIDDLAAYFSYDSTYGSYARFIAGFQREKAVEVKGNTLFLNGVELVWLNDPSFRVPGNIPWSDHGVEAVIDTTGGMTDPTVNDDNSLRGHLNHARKVVLSAPFKIKKKGTPLPDDAVTLVGGVNFSAYDAARHSVISNPSGPWWIISARNFFPIRSRPCTPRPIPRACWTSSRRRAKRTPARPGAHSTV